MSIGNATWQTMALSDDVQEHWVLHLTDDLGGTLRLSTHPGMDGAAPVYPAVTAWGAIRRSIDIVKCVAKLENTTVTCCNMLIDGTALWDRLKPGATRKFINRDATLYSLLAGRTASASAVATLRLISVSRPKGGKVVLSFEPRQPWDFIDVPSVKGPGGAHYPLVVGNFTHNTSEVDDQDYCTSMALWPAPVYEVGKTFIRALSHEDSSSGTFRLHSWEPAIEQFVPLSDSTPAFQDAAVAEGSGYFVQAHASMHMGIKAKCQRRDDPATTFSNPDRAFDSKRADDTGTTYAAVALVANTSIGGGLYSDEERLDLDLPVLTTTYYGNKTLTVRVTTSNVAYTNDVALRLYNAEDGYLSQVTLTVGTSEDAVFTLGASTSTVGLYLIAKNISSSLNASVLVYLSDVRLKANANLPDTADEVAVNQTLGGIKTLYCGADGLTRSWTTGAATQIHELHRELIHRFTGYTTTPTGWSALDTARSGWYCRWWQLKPRKLKDILEQAQYEGGFIWDWAPDGTGRYIYVKASYAAGDVAYTLVETLDCEEIDRGHTAFSDLLTKQEISYERHPADDSRFLSSYTHTNTTARTAWNIQTDENIAQVELEMLVSESAVQDHAEYHDTVRGDLRETFRLRIRRPRARILTIGDIVKVSGESAYHMVIGETRLPGSLDLETREVG